MTEREVTDAEGTVWSCVQAFAGVGGQSAAAQSGAAQTAAEKLAEKLGAGEGEVAVVATPRGGAQTVRLALPADWAEAMDDAALAAAIAEARSGA